MLVRPDGNVRFWYVVQLPVQLSVLKLANGVHVWKTIFTDALVESRSWTRRTGK